MILPSGFNGRHDDLLGELKQQREAAQQRRLEPTPPAEFSKWVTETLREHNSKYQNLASEHHSLNAAAEKASIGLKRLEDLIHFKDKARFDYINDMHKNFVFENRNLGYILDRCRKAVDETTVNYPMISQTLNTPLADRHKKIGMQRELGLRLRDIDQDFKRCDAVVAKQKKEMEQLSRAIQGLMHKAKIKLPPKLRENMDREDKVAEIAFQYRDKLRGMAPPAHSQNGNGAALAPKPKPEPKEKPQPKLTATNESAGFGDEVSSDTSKDSGQQVIDMRLALAAAAAGSIAGLLLMYALSSQNE